MSLQIGSVGEASLMFVGVLPICAMMGRCRHLRITCVVACVATMLLGVPSLVAPATAETSAALRALTDAQLEARAARHDGDAQRAGLQLLDTDARQAVVSDERDRALVLLNRSMAEAYKTGPTGSLGARIVLAGGVARLDEGIRITRIIGRHRAGIVRALDDAEARIALGSLDRARLIRTMTTSQRELALVQAEQQRRAQLRAERAAERARVRTEKQASEIAAQQAIQQAMLPATGGALVALAGGGSSAGPIAPQMIDAYLASKGSPMAGQGAAFVASGMRWRVDPRLLVAIAGAESNFGAITCGPNNAWGWSCPNSPEAFETWAAGIETVTSGLRRYYLDEGRTSLALIQQKYCPVGAANDPTGLNSHWLTNVTRFLGELGGNPANVGPGPSSAAGVMPDIGGLGMLGG